MGRTKSPINTELNADVPLSDDLNVSLNAMTQHRMEIMQQFGDGLPYERERIVHEARFYMAQSAESMLEAGKRLIILKENEPHGDFTNILENDLGKNQRTGHKTGEEIAPATSAARRRTEKIAGGSDGISG